MPVKVGNDPRSLPTACPTTVPAHSRFSIKTQKHNANCEFLEQEEKHARVSARPSVVQIEILGEEDRRAPRPPLIILLTRLRIPLVKVASERTVPFSDADS